VSAFLKWVAIAAVVVAVLLVLFVFDPATALFYPNCMFHSVTGLDCPFCGTSRALHQLLHGHFVAAWRLNPLVVVALPLIGAAVALRQGRGRGARFVASLNRPAWWWALLAVALVFTVARNLHAT
jgi:hypothetical protein